jgi:hypothetical protein
MREYRIPSERKKDQYYSVVDRDGRWSCSCPHWGYRLKGKAACKHIDIAKTHDARMENIMRSFEGLDFTVELFPQFKGEDEVG